MLTEPDKIDFKEEWAALVETNFILEDGGSKKQPEHEKSAVFNIPQGKERVEGRCEVYEFLRHKQHARGGGMDHACMQNLWLMVKDEENPGRGNADTLFVVIRLIRGGLLKLRAYAALRACRGNIIAKDGHLALRTLNTPYALAAVFPLRLPQQTRSMRLKPKQTIEIHIQIHGTRAQRLPFVSQCQLAVAVLGKLLVCDYSIL